MSDKPAILGRFPRVDVERMTAHHRGRLGSLLAVDEMVERLVRTLRRTGQLENTIVMFTSDNGWLLGEHRIAGQKYFGFEEADPRAAARPRPGLPARAYDRRPRAQRRPRRRRSCGPPARAAGRPPDGVALQRTSRAARRDARPRHGHRDRAQHARPAVLLRPAHAPLRARGDHHGGDRAVRPRSATRSSFRACTPTRATPACWPSCARRLDGLKDCRGPACLSAPAAARSRCREGRARCSPRSSCWPSRRPPTPAAPGRAPTPARTCSSS